MTAFDPARDIRVVREPAVYLVGRQVVDDLQWPAFGTNSGERALVPVYQVERVKGPWLWLVPEDRGKSGWVKAVQVVPYDQAIPYFIGEIRAHPNEAKAYLGRASLWRERKEYGKAMADYGIGGIDLLYVNLYPFEATVASGAVDDACIENIDIGGPAMIRSAAKNHAYVAVCTEPSDLEEVVAALQADGATTLALRKSLAARAYASQRRA